MDTPIPRVAVVMAAYNAARFVREAVDSILGQTFQAWTLIAVDDASTDDTLAILRSCASRDPRVQVHGLPKNMGAIAARNAGLALSTTDFVAVMDADDVSLPTRLEAQVRYMDAHPEIGAAGSFVQFIDHAGVRGAVKTGPTDPVLVAWLLFFLNSIAHPSLMLRRQVVNRLGGYLPSWAEDFDLVVRASRIAKVGIVPEVLVLYRRWPGNMTGRHWEGQEADAARIVQENVSTALGRRICMDTAVALRGLPTEKYPTSGSAIADLGAIVRELAGVFPQQAGLSDGEAALVRRDAAIKLLLLATLSLRKSPALAATLARHGLTLYPTALFPFAGKVARRLNPFA